MTSTLITIDAALAGIGDWSELTARNNDGLTVALLWSKATNRVKVTVDDPELGEELELEVAGADALAAFHHPFAFAAARGLGFGNEPREPTDLQLQS